MVGAGEDRHAEGHQRTFGHRGKPAQAGSDERTIFRVLRTETGHPENPVLGQERILSMAEAP